MSKFEYMGLYGGRLEISECGEDEGAYLLSSRSGIAVKPEDAPTVAAEILKAAGVPGVFIEGGLPEVTLEQGKNVEVLGQRYWLGGINNDAPWWRNHALRYAAIAQHLETRDAAKQAEEAAAKAAEAKLAARRDEVADLYWDREFWTLGIKTQGAVDAIIALRDKLAERDEPTNQIAEASK